MGCIVVPDPRAVGINQSKHVMSVNEEDMPDN